MFVEQVEGERIDVAGRHGGEGDPVLAQLRQERGDRQVVIAEAEGVGHGDHAGHAERTGPFDDEAELPAPERPTVVEVQVDAAAVSLGDAEDQIEVTYGIAVETRRVDPADQVGAG